MNETENKLSELKKRFECILSAYFASFDDVEEPLYTAVRYSMENGGKRIRPCLVYLGAEFAGYPISEVDKLAVAIELIHGYSLVHDDLPSMDNDTLRRNKPTTHIKFGEGMAVITGDAMLNLAYEAALSADRCDADYLKAVKYMARAAGIFGMVGGQCVDIRDNSKKDMKESDLLALYELKTSRLLQAALVGGAAACGVSDKELVDLERYACDLGVAYQIVDDILDVTSTEQVLGKNINSDKKLGKLTYVDFVGVDGAKKYAETLACEARDIMSVYGERGRDLIMLSDSLIGRDK